MDAKSKKFFVILLKIAAVSAVAVLMTIITENYFVPWASSNKFLSGLRLIKKASEKTTIINKTEQITVREDDSANVAASKAVPSIIRIVSISNKSKKETVASTPYKSGTGIIATGDGMIITHRNTIFENDANYKIMLSDGNVHDGKLMAIDDFTDLAFLKTEASNLTPISFANSYDFRAGKKVIAIGNVQGDYQNQFSSGLISGINKTFNISGKTLSSTEKLEGVIETDFLSDDAFIGGPLVSFNGELVGVTGKVVVDNKPYYFAIPSNIVKEKMELTIQNKISNASFFGAYYLPVTKELAAVMSLPRDKGALIYSPSEKQGLAIISGSPAEKAGLRINDIIISVGGREVNLDNPLSNLLNQHDRGEEIGFSVIRDGKEIELKAKL